MLNLPLEDITRPYYRRTLIKSALASTSLVSISSRYRAIEIPFSLAEKIMDRLIDRFDTLARRVFN